MGRPLSRIVMAALCTIAPLALTFVVVEATLPKPLRVAWQQLLAALMCALGYCFYVRRVERRVVAEFAAPGAVLEIASGLALGAALCLASVGVLGALGVYRVEGGQCLDGQAAQRTGNGAGLGVRGKSWLARPCSASPSRLGAAAMH